MRISDWSSDVCSSDLIVFAEADAHRAENDRILAEAIRRHGRVVLPVVLNNLEMPTSADLPVASLTRVAAGLGYINIGLDDDELGRASCRERVCQYVSNSGVAVSLQKKNKQEAK